MNNNNKKILLLIIGIAISPFLFAQEKTSSEPWTLMECINYALKNNINIKRSNLNVLQNRSSVDQSKADLLPSLNGRATHTYNYGKNQNPATGVLEDFNARGNTFGLSANVTLYNGFTNYNTIKQNTILLDAILADLEQAKNDVGLNVARAYLQVIVNDELLRSSKIQLETSKEQLKRTAILVVAGSLAKLDELQALSQKALNESQVVNNENTLELSKLQLMQLIQLPYDPNFAIVIPDLNPNDFEPVLITSSEIYDIALNTQPNVKSTALRMAASEAGLAAAKGNRLPTISGFASIDTRYSGFSVPGFEPDPFSNQLESNLGQNLGFSLNVPIFNNYRVKQGIQNSTINKERATLNDIDTKNNLRQQIEQAYFNATAALKAYSSAEQQVDALKLTFENMEKQKHLGAINNTDFTLAQNNLSAAESDMIRAKYDYIFKLKILDFYQGKPLDF
ncbi:MAG: TolC family protein [Cyclobacteriaceae bacterium]|nr:TolC family protein [Cyclobacteriaceae bacterium]